MKKKIAIIIPSVERGGAERVASLLSKYLSKRGYEVHFFVQQYDKKRAYTIYGTVHLMKQTKSVTNELVSLAIKSAQVWKLKKKYKIDITISFMEESNYINILTRQKDKIIIRVCTILSDRKDEFKQSLLYKPWLMRSVYNRADQIVVMTDYARDDLVRNYGIHRKKIKKIVNPIDSSHHAGDRSDWLYGDFTVLSVCRLDKVKQLWYLLRAFSYVLSDEPKAELILLGDGECENYLKNMAKELNISPKVHFLGHQRDVEYYYLHSKVQVITSKAEGYPNSMIEGLKAGIPVISVDCPGAPREILQPGTIYNSALRDIEMARYGILIPALKSKIRKATQTLTNEEQLLREAITMILTESKIYERYHNCYKGMILKNSLENIGDKWERLFND